MIRITPTLALLILIVSSAPAKTNAAIVFFTGSLSSGSGVLGNAPPALPFSISLDFTAAGPGLGMINSGQFSSAPQNIALTGGDILLIENGASDQALFSINTTAPAGAISVTVTGNGLTNNQVTTQNLVALINASSFTSVSANFGASGNYTGSVISAVPEPGSALLLSGASLALAFCRRRRFNLPLPGGK